MLPGLTAHNSDDAYLKNRSIGDGAMSRGEDSLRRPWKARSVQEHRIAARAEAIEASTLHEFRATEHCLRLGSLLCSGDVVYPPQSSRVYRNSSAVQIQLADPSDLSPPVEHLARQQTACLSREETCIGRWQLLPRYSDNCVAPVS